MTIDCLLNSNHIRPINSFWKLLFLALIPLYSFLTSCSSSHNEGPQFSFLITVLEPASQTYNVELQCSEWPADTILLKMPNWMPGYYQIMDYANTVENIKVLDSKGNSLPIDKQNGNSWLIKGLKEESFSVSYSIKTSRQFVANSYVDSLHAYIIPTNTFLYADGLLNSGVNVKLQFIKEWGNVATGLDLISEATQEYRAANFDILYDCPILIGNLEALPSFSVNGIEHRFIGYKIGDFDKNQFMANLNKIVTTSVNLIGDIPYKQYTFIGIGPGRGGIEHLNNTTISFDGSKLDNQGSMDRMMNFIAHEYFHHYNVKRIRPFELGPFDYDNGNRTNLLWISEGLSVYYEYMIVKRAGLVDEKTLFTTIEKKLNAHENNAGRHYQSLQQASYNTWSDGPFGTSGNEPGKAISYYDKGPLVGMLLDFEIRNATQNKKSLDDVMRALYYTYYKKENRGFTEAEFQHTCEVVSGKNLSSFFEYVYTTKELDYDLYLAYAGLTLKKEPLEIPDKGRSYQFSFNRLESPTQMQAEILNSWLGDSIP